MNDKIQDDAFKRLWLCEYESGQAFITHCLQHYRSLKEADQQAFRDAVHAFASQHNMKAEQPIRALLEALARNPHE